MEITIKNCNNIDEAKVSLEPLKLNIKYGPNGTGKSTIAKAISLSSGENNLSSLKPFKHRDGNPEETPPPSVQGAEQFKMVSVFNEEYVNQFVFTRDEVVKNSFDIFIRNSDYDAKMAEIESLVSDIKDAFHRNNNIEQIQKDLLDLSDSFGKSQSGYSKSGRIGKGIGSGNKLEHIPEKLSPYSSLIKSESNVKWIKWQIEGNEFLEISASCPYCTSSTEDKKETILAVSQEYDAKSIEHLNVLQGIISRLGKYFSQGTLEKVNAIVKNKTGLKKEEITYLTGLKGQVDTLREKFGDIKSISFFTLRDVDGIKEKISNLKIDLNLLDCLNSQETSTIVNEINSSLDGVIDKAGKLEGEINKQKKGIESAISKYKSEINGFLACAGYKYEIDISADGDSYKMKLKHLDFGDAIENGALHLSYGERNAFSIVLFMYECLMRNPDLIVLDDPISSFDKNKKFAILEMLFRGKKSLRGRTVLMLTHDMEPIIDMIKNLGHIFQPTPAAYFLSSRSGVVSEIEIEREDILSFAQICEENIARHTESLVKVIYLRRHYEIVNDKGFEYQLLSNLLHKRAQPVIKYNLVERPMSPEEINSATTSIKDRIADFDYVGFLVKFSDKTLMTTAYHAARNNYEKLQLFRVASDGNHANDVIKKYINESFHIENEYIMQLNPSKYDFIPEHIIDECNKSMTAQ